MKFKTTIKFGLLTAIIVVAVVAAVCGFRLDRPLVGRSIIDQLTLNRIAALDRANHQATFVFVNPELARQVKQNKVIVLPPIDDKLCIDFRRYEHKGRYGDLFIIIPESYHGPKEKFILKSFPNYKGWCGSMLTNNFVMYTAH